MALSPGSAARSSYVHRFATVLMPQVYLGASTATGNDANSCRKGTASPVSSAPVKIFLHPPESGSDKSSGQTSPTGTTSAFVSFVVRRGTATSTDAPFNERVKDRKSTRLN